MRKLVWSALPLLLAGLVACSGDNNKAASENTDSQNAKKVVRIATLNGTSDVVLGRDRGTLEQYLASKNIEVKWEGPFNSAAPAYEAINAKAIDITVGSSSAFANVIANGVQIDIFAYQPMPAFGEGIVVAKDSNINSVHDLVGKKVAVNKGGTGEYLLSIALKNNNIPEDKVEKSYMLPSDTGTAFSGKHVDAWATWDPYLSVAQDLYNAKILVGGGDLKSSNAVGYFADSNYAKQNPEVIQAVFEGLKQENDWAKANQEEAGKVWANRLGYKDNANIASNLGKVNTVPLRSLSDADVEDIVKLAHWYHEKGIIKAVPDVKKHVIQLPASKA
ncbi:aliphatic sulfonate ABC transporter substrate-binding protein [Vitreoscilla stercoraria]|uniref:Aliphatic sulfonate ABC transporter substrate-binding protein n=1 Tax=Vitreoscilla stercoraria TaxID=61 RepID=A0ABY4E9S4_VITST|nr:aliphatic sulfonate ABC transporter substrate-binding protein [Vitreoscilla stercoraria]UOO92513.1 aliphatic sulfonate ABC transporter substrate-binding protein [Vitreoscilla stercoraria]